MSNPSKPFANDLADPLAETLAIQAIRSGKLDPRHVLLRSIGQHARSQSKDVVNGVHHLRAAGTST